jgi:hypothetical protein
LGGDKRGPGTSLDKSTRPHGELEQRGAQPPTSVRQAASNEPDVGILKRLVLEAAMTQTFGSMEWRDKVEERRKATQDAKGT